MQQDRFSRLATWLDREVEMARQDFERMESTAAAHPCDDCTITLRNKRVKLATLLDVQRAANVAK